MFCTYMQLLPCDANLNQKFLILSILMPYPTFMHHKGKIWHTGADLEFAPPYQIS